MEEIPLQLPGLHHVTAICSDPQQNIDFYTGVLELRLVKLTVNFDDPGSYHLYYGDEVGHPGTILTFFAWPGAYRGHVGPPQVTATSFAAPAGSRDDWATRLKERGVVLQAETERFGERVLSFSDPDGMPLEIVLTGPAEEGGAIANALRGFHSVTIAEEGYENTAKLLTEVMEFEAVGSEQNRFRYEAGSADGGPGRLVDLVCVPDARHGSLGAGVVHHVAFRTPDDLQQRLWRQEIVRAGPNVSPVMDRSYFHSIYYREPGGVLFEIATNHPGFAVDEPAEQLGHHLKLPAWLEGRRVDIERVLPPVRLPAAGG